VTQGDDSKVNSSLTFISNNIDSLGIAVSNMTKGAYSLLDSQRDNFLTQQYKNKEEIISLLDT